MFPWELIGLTPTFIGIQSLKISFEYILLEQEDLFQRFNAFKIAL